MECTAVQNVDVFIENNDEIENNEVDIVEVEIVEPQELLAPTDAPTQVVNNSRKYFKFL